MSVVAPSQSTYAQIEQKVRRLTASSSESSLSAADIAQYINDVYSTDFPYGIKLDQMRSVYTFYTRPNIGRYPLDVNYNQGVRAPMYVEGIQGTFFKDRNQFYNMWPRWPTKFQPSGLTSGTITGITAADPAVVTSVAHGLSTGDNVNITNVLGMTEVNGVTFLVTVLTADTFSLGIDSSLYTAYTSGGTWTDQSLSFTIAGPFLSKEVVYGTVSTNGAAITIADDGNGNLQLQTPNSVTSVPVQTTNPPVPGMYNVNTGNPGLLTVLNVGSVNYVTGAFTINFATAGVVPDNAVTATLWVSQYQTGRPYSMMFWNNEFTIRPIPDKVHKVEIETYLTPVQFLLSTDNPILNQWWKLLAYYASQEILRDRQDFDGVAGLQEGMKRQEGLVLERQGTEEIGSRNVTLFASEIQGQNGSNGYGQGWY